MKKQFTLLFALLTFFGVSLSAQQTVWNFADVSWDGATVATGTTVNGLTNYSINNKAAIDGSNKAFTLDGTDYAFTKRFKFGENGKFDAVNETEPITGVLSFVVNGNAAISVIGAHASSSGADRNLVVAYDNNGFLTEIGRLTVAAGQLGGQVFQYSGDAATTIYLYSVGGGVNLYMVSVNGADSEPVIIPSVSVSPSALTLNSSTLSASFVVTGTNLTENVVLTAPAGITLTADGSTTEINGISLTKEAVMSQGGVMVTATFDDSADIEDIIEITSTDATTKKVSVIATVGDPSGLGQLDATKEVQSVQYFDITGRELKQIEKSGYIIEKTNYTDGSTSVKKVYRNI